MPADLQPGDLVRIPCRPDRRGTTYPVIRSYRLRGADYVDVSVPGSQYSQRYAASQCEPVEAPGGDAA